MSYLNSGMTFDGLRQANRQRLPQFRDRQGRVAHQKPDGSDWSKAEWLQAMVGEVGELANLFKKVRRGDFTDEQAAALGLAPGACQRFRLVPEGETP